MLWTTPFQSSVLAIASASRVRVVVRLWCFSIYRGTVPLVLLQGLASSNVKMDLASDSKAGLRDGIWCPCAIPLNLMPPALSHWIWCPWAIPLNSTHPIEFDVPELSHWIQRIWCPCTIALNLMSLSYPIEFDVRRLRFECKGSGSSMRSPNASVEFLCCQVLGSGSSPLRSHSEGVMLYTGIPDSPRLQERFSEGIFGIPTNGFPWVFVMSSSSVANPVKLRWTSV